MKEVTELWREKTALSQEHLQLMREIGFHTLMSFPLELPCVPGVATAGKSSPEP